MEKLQNRPNLSSYSNVFHIIQPDYENTFRTPTRSRAHAALLETCGYFIEIVRQPGTQRVIYYHDDTHETREIIRIYEAKEPLFVPLKLIVERMNDLAMRSKAIIAGGTI